MLKAVRLAAWAAVAIVAIAAGLVALGLVPTRLDTASLPFAARVGGPFELTRHDGRRMSSAELAGRPYAIFFGFTFCPDVCPTTLHELSLNLKDLGPDADRITYLFVSVDPERDTPEQLKLYLSSFDPRIVGLTGTTAEIASLARAYRVYYERVPTKEGYTMNHTSSVFLMDAKGGFVGTMTATEPMETRVAKLRRLAQMR